MSAPAPRPLSPGDVIGILGGGQLGRMLAMAAARLGLRTHVFAPAGDNPAFDVATRSTIGDYADEAALAAFAQAVDVVTYEFENVPARAAAALAAHRPVLPDARALSTTQDRLVEKDFVRALGIATAPYMAVDDAGGLARAVAALGRPSILKTRRFGYDGKGQATIRGGADLGGVFRALGGAPCILEGMVPFIREVSVVAARGLDGAFAAYDVCENHHEHHILARTLVPARVSGAATTAALDIARRIAEALDYIGVLAVEMFIVETDGAQSVLVNEIAPRVHNSGHWTLDGAAASQFEQHIRAVAGWPLGSTARRGRVEMRNLIGDQAAAWRDILAEPGACLHLYGKAEIRAGRKMGHVTRVISE
ncbi:MAG: 5-(carboxyamino)imidazole ribonucleotide synthase [Methylobacteriaceae bacterium]|nr:5-(carboxyamino)imidazole ribonucleotide synthase [Methylobacteriaceae bacterium]